MVSLAIPPGELGDTWVPESCFEDRAVDRGAALL